MLTIKRPESKSKSQVKCFGCRRSLTSRDGKWIQREGQQVFLCPVCLLEPVKPKGGTP